MPRWIANPIGAHGLLVMLVVEFFAAPLVLAIGSPSWLVLLHAVYQIILFMFLFGLTTHPFLFGVCAALLLAGSAARLVMGDTGLGPNPASYAPGATASLVVVLVVVRRFFKVPEVTAATLSLALSVYLLSGLFWGLVYTAIEGALPRAFEKASGPVNASDLHYFSYVTMTTLGYGDVVPARPIARSCALLQTLLGQVFIAVVIGRIVSVYVARETRGQAPREGER